MPTWQRDAGCHTLRLGPVTLVSAARARPTITGLPWDPDGTYEDDRPRRPADVERQRLISGFADLVMVAPVEGVLALMQCSLSECADRLGYQYQALHKWVQGDREMSRPARVSVLAQLGVVRRGRRWALASDDNDNVEV